MSNRTGDKSRHNRQRKEKIRRRERFGALTQTAPSAPKQKTAKPAKPAKTTKPAAK